MLFAALIAGFFAGFAPFWGLLFLIAYGFRYFQEDPVRYFGIFVAVAVVSVLFINGQFLALSIYDAFIGVGAIGYFFLKTRNSGKTLSWNIFYTSIVISAVSSIRTLLFSAVLKQQSIESSKASKELLMEFFSDNEQMLSIAIQSIDQSSKFLAEFSTAIWFLVLVFAMYLAVFWQTSRRNEPQRLSSFELPYWIVYPLIISMVAFLTPTLKIAGANMLMIIMPLMLFQGLAVSQTYLKKVFPNRNANWYSFFLIIIFNYLYISFLVLIGILDIWMHFRIRLRNINSSKFNQ